MVYDIIKYMHEELIKKIKESSFFNELQEYIYAKIFELNSIKGLSDKSNLEVGETVKARAIAVTILEEILSPFINIVEKKQPTEEQIKLRKKQVGL
jgi:hypothetical protein